VRPALAVKQLLMRLTVRNVVLTELGVLGKLAFPLAISQLGLMALGLVDAAIVGQESKEAFAAVTVGRSVAFACMAFGMGLGMTLEPIVSQALAAGEPQVARNALKQTLTAVFLIAFPTALLAFALTYALRIFHIEEATLVGARQYLLGNLPGVYFFLAYLPAKTFLQAHGRTAPMLWAALVANIVNVVACNVLVRGDAALRAIGLAPVGLPKWGPFGAGVAGTIASGILFAGCYIATARMAHVTDRQAPAGDAPVPQVPSVRKLFIQALPVGVQLLAEVGVFSLTAFLATGFGTVVNNAHQIVLGLASFTFMGALGVAGATSIRVGNAVGEGRSARLAGMLGIGLGASYMCISALGFTLFAPNLARLFAKEADVAKLAIELLHIAAVFQLMDGVQGVAGGALRGAGDLRFTSIANLVSHWVIGLPLALLFAYGLGMGVHGLWWGLTSGIVVVAVVMTIRFYRISGQAIARM
jgi:multidrug resistance protein, MATE family